MWMRVPMDTNSSFGYGNLSQGEFRLLDLAPAVSTSSPLQANIFTTRLDVSDQYEVLCYTWGPSTENDTINCHGRSISILRNLADALYSIRGKYRSRRLWVDALCINQSDAEEKNTQVSLMYRISSQAFQGIFWVGVETSLARAAFQLLPIIVLARQEVFQESISSPTRQVSVEHTLVEYRKKLPPPGSVGWKGLDDILDRAFFMRVWTLPDIMCISNAILHCGSLTIPWADFWYGLEGYASYSFPNVLRSPGLQMVINARRLYLKSLRDSPSPLGLDIVLDAMRGLSAANRMDKCYAACSILNTLTIETEHMMPAPDYSKSVEEVYVDVAKALNAYPRLAPSFCSLSMAEDPGSYQHDQERVPSWVPQWSNQGPTYHLNTKENFFYASKHLRTRDVNISPQGDFSFTGCVIDRVNQVADYLPPRRIYDKYNASGGNSFLFLNWYEWANTIGQEMYQKGNERIFLNWIETIQAKGCDLWQALEPRDPATLLAHARTWLKYLSDEDEQETEDIPQFYAACLPSHGRRFGVSARGHFCLFPKSTRRSDSICIPFGSKVPFIFRKDRDHYQNIGECYVHSAMDGDALGWDGVEEEKFIVR